MKNLNLLYLVIAALVIGLTVALTRDEHPVEVCISESKITKMFVCQDKFGICKTNGVTMLCAQSQAQPQPQLPFQHPIPLPSPAIHDIPRK